MANTQGPAVSFGYFDQLPAELQVNIIELALENLLANRITNVTTITFKPGWLKLSLSILSSLIKVNRLFRHEVIRLSQKSRISIYPPQHKNHERRGFLYFDSSTEVLELSFERTPSAEVWRLERLPEALTKRVRQLKLRLSHNVYYYLAHLACLSFLSGGVDRESGFWTTLFGRFPIRTHVQVAGARCGSLYLTQEPAHEFLNGYCTGIISQGRKRFDVKWLGC
jgi:hypothetical protein